jgi:O-antigen ligase
MLEMSLPFAVGLVFNFAPHGIRAAAACMGAAVAALLFAGIAVSLSRGGFFIALASLLLFVWLHAITGMRGKLRLITVAGSVLAAGCAAVIVAPGRLLDRMVLPSHGEIPMNDRFLFWKETAHVIAAYPVFGCGFGGLVSAVTPWRASSVMRTLDYAHNDYLQFLAEGGIVPFALAAVVGAMVARSVWRGVFRQHSRQRRGFAIACAASLFAGLVHSGVDLITYVPATAMLLCWIAGMAAGLDFDPPRKGHVLP